MNIILVYIKVEPSKPRVMYINNMLIESVDMIENQKNEETIGLII